MPGTATLLAFVAASLVLLITPGPGVMYVVTRSVSQGRRAGLVSVLGLSTGALLHVFAAVAGLSFLVARSATAFTVLKLAGAVYLVFLGIRSLRSRQPARLTDIRPDSLRRVFADGVIVSVLNPKIALFFLAFLPQFVRPDGAPASVQLLVLGGIYVALAIVTDGLYALLASRARAWLGRGLKGPWPRYVSGGVYIGLGVTTALGGRR